jgi:hypothetical protein
VNAVDPSLVLTPLTQEVQEDVGLTASNGQLRQA